jgi:hypothetical protein
MKRLPRHVRSARANLPPLRRGNPPLPVLPMPLQLAMARHQALRDAFEAASCEVLAVFSAVVDVAYGAADGSLN